MSKSKKAKYGQFNTESNECKFTIDELKKRFDLKGSVLEPSFGTGNFVKELKTYELEVDCYEIDEKIFKKIDGTNSVLGDFLFSEIEKEYEFIIGNPPYIELAYSFYSEDDIKKLKSIYKTKGRGRVNLVHFFMDKSFNLLKQNGVIAYLLPSTILSSPWYNDIRKKIFEEYTVIDIISNIPFKSVSIDVCLLIIQKKFDPTHNFIRLKNDLYILTKNLSEGKTLKERGFDCQIGNFLWYKNKDILTDLRTTRTLIYSNNIGNGELKMGINLKSKIPGKKQYLNTQIPISIENCIVMPRVISKKMRFALILNNQSYFFENHVMVITHKDVNLIVELFEKLKKNQISFQDFFNSSNITVNEILNFSY